MSHKLAKKLRQSARKAGVSPTNPILKTLIRKMKKDVRRVGIENTNL